ncbi:MAG: Ig-like domain repeat protein [Candidatus Bipolaricaulis sp.]|nr:Ig-like domain repeat protein [Candidatus Bipolaricaulis sp.]
MNWFVVGNGKMGRTPRRSGRALVLALSLVLGLGLAGIAQTATTTSLESDVNPSVYGQSVTFTATVSPTPDGGTVTFKDGGTDISGPVAVSTTSGKAQFSTSSLSVGTHSITAEYSGTANYNPSTSSPLTQTVNKRLTTTTVFGSDTPLVVGDTVTCTVRVVDTSLGEMSMPTGNVTVSVSPTGQGTPTSWSHTLVAADAGEFRFTYTPNSAATPTHTFNATYAGDSTHNGSTGSFNQAIIKRAADIQLTCDPSTAYIGQPVTVTVRVEDDTTAGTASVPTGTVAFSDGTKNGVFSSDTADLSGGTCTVTYTPAPFDAGMTTITATYNGSSVHTSKSTTQLLTVNLRPTEVTVNGCTNTILVNQGCTYTVTVNEADGIPGTATVPFGTLSYSSYLGGDATQVPNSGAAPSGTFVYMCLGLDGHAGIDSVYADYAATDGIHANSSGVFGQGIQRRPTITTVTGSSTASGVTYTATVQEDSGNAGTATILQGRIHLLSPDKIACSGLSGTTLTCTDSFDTTSPLANVTVQFEPTDRTHLGSTGSKNIERYDQFPPGPGDETTGAECDDGCGSGGVNIPQMIFDLNAAIVALEAVKLGLDATALVLDVIPDGVIVGGLLVSTGVTIPYSDIAKAIVAGAGIAIDTAILEMETDLDGDGIPNILELAIGTSPNKWDTDGDGLGDLDEIEEAGGYYGGSRRPNPNVADSDGDGLSDGDEAGLYNTSFCVADTDCDTVSDGTEVGTWNLSDIRNHADPLMQDTDGDGLRDDLELTAGCPFVNDADSDDDGLQDGYEDRDRDGIITNIIGNSSTQGSGETCFCTWDTDGDGLSDGEEEDLFGTSVTPKGVSTTVGVQGANLGATVPALDTDMDNDGLPDYAETNTYQTNPIDADTDDDTLSDSAEVATWADADARNHANPREADSDGDGLTDNLEIAMGCPYVNDADSDDDGLQDGYEDTNRNGAITNTIGDSTSQGSGETDFCLWDTDSDGLSDGEEEALFGTGSVSVATATGTFTTVPGLDDDSDNDGLSDWEEVNVTGTNPLDADTDNDTISDANELIATGGAWPKRTFIQESDPLDPDTDDDGLPDAIEYPGTGLGISRGLGGSPDTVCPIVNDDDSDDDGLQDGYEDKNKDGIWNNYQIGHSATQGWGETCACNPDSDGDGLQDGEEEELLGRTATPQGMSTVFPLGTSAAPAGYTVLPGAARGTGNDLLAPYTFAPAPGLVLPLTVPALDTDSDNDGLSDYEEVNVTSTDPLDADTDNDTLADADELVAVSGTWPKRQFDQVSDPLNINTDGDHLFDPQEFSGSGLSTRAGALGGTRDTQCPYVDDDDSDDDGIQDGAVVTRTFVAVGVTYSWTHYEDFADIAAADVGWPGTVRLVVTDASGEQQDDSLCNVCDPDSDSDGLLDGEEVGIGTDPGDWDTDDDGRNDWHEVTGGGPIPTDPFDPDTDDDGLLDSAEVFGSNPTNPVNCDTDADGLCDGGARTPYMTSGHPSVVVNPRCLTGIGGHPNPLGIGEDEDGDGTWDSGETNPNNPDTDGDAVGDGIERLSFSVSRQSLIPKFDLFGRPITVLYPEANNVKPVCGCMNPVTPDSDGDGLLDGEEDLNHDGHFDFLVSDFDYGHHGPIPGPAYGSPLETNPCDPDTDHDGLTDLEELRGQANPPSFFPFNPTNPLDHDTDNDWIYDGPEVRWLCSKLLFVNLDNDGDGLIDEDPVDLIDNDGDGYVDEDDVDFYVRYVPVLDPTNCDSDSDGFIDGLDEDPCNTQLIPIVRPVVKTPVDTDGDGFADDDEIAAGTHPNDPTSFPCAFYADLDLDGVCDDRLWLTDTNHDGTADTVTIDIDANVLVDLRVEILSRDVQRGDFAGDGQADDGRYTISYAFANRRVIQPRLTVVIFDYGCDLRVDQVEVTK